MKSIPKPDTSASKLGKIMYERDFLLRFKDVCTDCPPNFPPFASIIGDAPSRSGGDRDRGGRGGSDDKWERGKPLAPSRGGAGRGGPPPGLGASGRGGASRGGDRGGVRESIQRRPIVKKGAKAPPVLEKVAPLVASSNRWVRPSVKEADATAVTLRKTQGYDTVSYLASICVLFLRLTFRFAIALTSPPVCLTSSRWRTLTLLATK